MPATKPIDLKSFSKEDLEQAHVALRLPCDICKGRPHFCLTCGNSGLREHALPLTQLPALIKAAHAHEFDRRMEGDFDPS